MKLTVQNRSTRRKTCPSDTFSTTNGTWTDPGSNPDLRVWRPATNSLSHGTASTGGGGVAARVGSLPPHYSLHVSCFTPVFTVIVSYVLISSEIKLV
jgi:hypothetical protein